MSVFIALFTGLAVAHLGAAVLIPVQDWDRANGDIVRMEPRAFDHDGIEDAFLEKASVVWYWHQGQWVRLRGAD